MNNMEKDGLGMLYDTVIESPSRVSRLLLVYHITFYGYSVHNKSRLIKQNSIETMVD